MVVINLYRFEDTVAKEGCTLAHAIENVDIGGPTMLRAAAKNYRFVSVVTDPEDYPKILAEMKETGGKISEATNFELAKKTYQLKDRYDGANSNYLATLGGSDEKRTSDTLHRDRSPRTRSCQDCITPPQKPPCTRGKSTPQGLSGSLQTPGRSSQGASPTTTYGHDAAC
jgi:AICAR transformylase/IMP cyclohydrolase PurH